MIIHLCGPKLYEYNGVFFELGYSWVMKLKKDGEPYKRQGDGFYKSIAGFLKLTETEREAFRVGGGCQCINTGETT